MLTSLSGRYIGLSALVCVLLLFFFPLPQGNFPSTHGPVTALRARRNILVLFLTLARAARLVFAILIAHALLAVWRWFNNTRQHPGLSDLSARSSILRC
jgi:hypothetical protein